MYNKYYKTMSLLCRMIDHKYSKASTKEEIEERNGQKISVRIKTEECKRCGKIKEDRIRTIIEPGVYTENEVDDMDEVDNIENDNNTQTQENIYSKSVDKQSIDSDDKSKSISSTSDEGVVILKQNEDESGDTILPTKSAKSVTVKCTDCSYEKVTNENYRRSGDFCPECSGWLKID